MKIEFRHKVLILFTLPIVILLTTIIAVALKGRDFAEIEYDIIRETRTLELKLDKSEILLRSAELIVLVNEVAELKKRRIKYEYLDTLGCLNIAFNKWDDVIDVTNYFVFRNINDRY